MVPGCPDISFMREILFLRMQMQGKKRSRHVLSQHCRVMKCEQTLILFGHKLPVPCHRKRAFRLPERRQTGHGMAALKPAVCR